MTEDTPDAIVADVAIDPIACVPSDTSLRDVARLLDGCGGGVVLLESDSLQAVTEHDIVRAVAEGRSIDTPASEIVHDRLLAVLPSTTLSTALHRMIDAEVRALVVLDREHRLVGLVTLRAVLGALLGPLPWVGALRLALHIETMPT